MFSGSPLALYSENDKQGNASKPELKKSLSSGSFNSLKTTYTEMQLKKINKEWKHLQIEGTLLPFIKIRSTKCMVIVAPLRTNYIFLAHV